MGSPVGLAAHGQTGLVDVAERLDQERIGASFGQRLGLKFESISHGPGVDLLFRQALADRSYRGEDKDIRTGRTSGEPHAFTVDESGLVGHPWTRE